MTPDMNNIKALTKQLYIAQQILDRRNYPILASGVREALTIFKPLADGSKVMVPREPTEAMIRAMHHQIDWCRNDQDTSDPVKPDQKLVIGGESFGTYCRDDLVDAYRAMLSAREE